MLLQTAPQNEAVLSNVGEIGEFRIRNSAKAFSILSSGLYANKVRAIIRELSCNAVDSHVAAGRAETPFDVHLPTTLEPWFAIRDYGTGLNHDQVKNIYTTYFESTKTNSNDFIGALGLGSKSPFSYTDNFTVTAIKDNRKGIYTAFINDAGVPSIALMGEEDTTEPSGVEIKFSVNDRWDFSKFSDEARTVYKYFKMRPVISGVDNFEFRNVEYETMNIVPGVHSTGRERAVAVMGNIAYPIDVPQANHKDLGDVAELLRCGLEIHFAIGELDFQASREGLSYIPQTIASIKAKLEAVNAQLAVHVAEEADKIENLWSRALFLNKKKDSVLWRTAVEKYIVDTKFEQLSKPTGGSYLRLKEYEVTLKDLASLYNIDVMAFQKSQGSKSTSSINSNTVYSKVPGEDNYRVWTFPVKEGVTFVKNDTKIGASARAKYHFNNKKYEKGDAHYQTVFVLNKVDKTKPAKFDEFLLSIDSPPTAMFASELMEKERKSSSASGKNVTIMVLQQRGYGGYHREREMVWKDAGKADQFDAKETYYYLPLSGYSIESTVGLANPKQFVDDLKYSGFGALNVDVYGVRKGDIEFIKTQKNWVNIETYIGKFLSNVTEDSLSKLALSSVDVSKIFKYNSDIANSIGNKNSPFIKIMEQLKNIPSRDSFQVSSLERLFQRYANTISVQTLVSKFETEATEVISRYPLLKSVDTYRLDNGAVAEYINLIDSTKGV